MGATQTNDHKGQVTTKSYSTCVKIIQLWLTSFAIGIPLLRLLLFLNLRNSEIIIVVFFTLLIFATMYILDVNEQSLREDDNQSYDGVTDAEHSHSISISPDQQDQKLETTVIEAGQRFDEPLQFDRMELNIKEQ